MNGFFSKLNALKIDQDNICLKQTDLQVHLFCLNDGNNNNN